jgi:SET domain-containing protein
MKRKTQRSAGKIEKPSFKTARFALEFRRSKIEGFGIYAKEDIPARKLVIEYTGEKISEKEADRRYEEQVRSKLPRHVYFFWLGRSIIDGSVGGSGAEYINHSCEPNLITWETRTRILLISRKVIRAGEELTYDYRFGADQEHYECRCGSQRCRGAINLRDPQRPAKRVKS